MRRIAVIGSGTWGVALASYLANQGNDVRVWSFAKEEVEMINNEKKCKFLPQLVIPKHVEASQDAEYVVDGAEIILHVTPSKFVRSTLQVYKDYVKENQPIIMCSKGFEPVTEKTFDVVVKEELPDIRFGVLSGPSHAEEVSMGIPTAIVIASEYESVIRTIREIFASKIMRIYSIRDVKGAEIGSALKNIIAFCAGICVGLKLGDNTFAALLTRGLVEITRLGTAMGADSRTFYGLTGLGDLIVTCGSEHSRNRRAGKMIGEGKTIEEARAEIGMVIESIDNIDVAYSLAKKYNVEMPIVNSVYDVLYNGLDPMEAVNKLMTRELKDE